MKRRHGRERSLAALVCTAAFHLGCADAQNPAADGSGLADFIDTRAPPAYAELTPAQRENVDLGHALLNTQWVPAGTPNAARRDGLGPLFNASSCDACHNEGAGGQGLSKDGIAPAALVIQLRRSSTANTTDSDRGDPVYGQVLNTSALAGFEPEAVARVHYEDRRGHFPDGASWILHAPHYELSDLRYGALSPDTAIKPRLAPPLFGVGLLQQVPDAALVERAQASGGRLPRRSKYADHRLGRFGWESATATIEEQTAVAMAREMGLTSALIDHDDCTAAQSACRHAPSGGSPEVSPQFMAALLDFQKFLAVPRTKTSATDASALFAAVGCEACHRKQLPVVDVPNITSISAYTDLLLHDLGPDLADRDASGRVLPAAWRTAPLWGLGHAARRPLTLLHDGRARSIEEAILWHGGEADSARTRFEQLVASERTRLLDWLAGL